MSRGRPRPIFFAVVDDVAAIGDPQRFADIVVGQEDGDAAIVAQAEDFDAADISTALGSTPLKGSSSMMSWARSPAARAISSLRRSPPESVRAS